MFQFKQQPESRCYVLAFGSRPGVLRFNSSSSPKAAATVESYDSQGFVGFNSSSSPKAAATLKLSRQAQ